MSRSYKKNPWYTEQHKDKAFHKKIANKRVRRFNHDFANGNAYRKLFSSYEICDYKFFCTFLDALREYDREEIEESEKEFWNRWHKYYKRK